MADDILFLLCMPSGLGGRISLSRLTQCDREVGVAARELAVNKLHFRLVGHQSRQHGDCFFQCRTGLLGLVATDQDITQGNLEGSQPDFLVGSIGELLHK